MSSSPAPAMGRPPHPASDRSYSNGEVTSATDNVTEQFRFMHVSGKCDNTELENLAKNFMSTLGINNPDDAKYAEQLAALTKQVSLMMGPTEPSGPSHASQVRNASNSGLPTFSSSVGTSESPKPTEKASTSPTINSDRRGRSPGRNQSRSRTPMGTRLRTVVGGVRSRSPWRNKDQSRSPVPSRNNSSSDNMTSDTDGDEEFYDSRMEVGSPAPKELPKTSGQNGGITDKPVPTPTSANRVPLASVNVSQATTNAGNSPMKSPDGQSAFKFNKEQDRFSIGSSPPKSNTKFGSPSKKGRSPLSGSKTKTPSPGLYQENHSDVSPLSDMGSLAGASPFPPSSTTAQSKTTSSPTPLFSPVPEFHAPHNFVGNSGSRRIPTPHNIMQNDPHPEPTNRRQTAPPNMASSAATAAASFGNVSSVDTKNPFDRSPEAINIPPTAPDTAETFIKKKTRNTATPPPNLDVDVAATNQKMFNVDLGKSTNKAKVKGRRGNTMRKAFKNISTSTKYTGTTSFVFGLDEIKEAGTDETATNSIESPSNGSAMSMDTSPFLSPPPQQQQGQQSSNGGMFNMGVGGQNTRTRSRRKESSGRRTQYQRSQSARIYSPVNDLAAKRAEILALKEQGKLFYLDKKFKESTRVYSEAIQRYNLEMFAHTASKDLLALLLWNRAAALLMIGAYDSAVEDSRKGIHFVSDPRNTNPALASPDANPALRPKLYFRMGRSYLKLGKVDDAERAFQEAIQSASAIQEYHTRLNVVRMHDELEKIKTEAMLEQTEVSRLRTLLDKIDQANQHGSRSKTDIAIEALGLVKMALMTASGCNDLHIMKVKLLAELKRWREVSSHCERFAALNTRFDGCLVEDLAKNNPFPGVPLAQNLQANYFSGTKEDELKGAEMKLDRNSAVEALLRLPYLMMPYYLRSLRLEERYYIAETCITKLTQYINEREITIGRSIHDHFRWLKDERVKLRNTKSERETADNLFSAGNYEEAAKSYARCLIIDSDGTNCAGGRLHAILHCNRAACFMVLKRNRDAMSECTAALRIYPRYLKALLRRARCYSRLNRKLEAENDYKQWLDIVDQSKKSGSNAFLGPCIFDGPHTVKAKEVEDTRAELAEFLKDKAREEAEERARKMYEEKSEQSKSERFNFSTRGRKSPAHEDAHKRRENWYNNQDSSRRWDSFKEERGRSKPKPKPKNTRDEYGYKSQSRSSASSHRDHKKYYSLLGVHHMATDDEIRKAYKRMALKCHPDKNRDDPEGASKKFLRVQEAYETLNDPRARRQYDVGR